MKSEKYLYPEKQLDTYIKFFKGIATVIPLVPWNAKTDKEAHKGKRPAAPLYRKDRNGEYLLNEDGEKIPATYSRDKLEAFRKRGCNFGISHMNSVLVIDVDVKNDAPGLESLDKLERETGLDFFTAFPYVETPSGGYHFYLRKPTDFDIPINISGFEGIDFQTGIRYVALPGSKHKSGGVYNWAVKPNKNGLPDMPEDLENLLAFHVEDDYTGKGYSKGGGIGDDDSAGRYTPDELRTLLKTIKTELPIDTYSDYMQFLRAAKHMTCKNDADDGGVDVVLKYLAKRGYDGEAETEETLDKWYNQCTPRKGGTTVGYLFNVADQIDGGTVKKRINQMRRARLGVDNWDSDPNDDFTKIKKPKVRVNIPEEFRERWEANAKRVKKLGDPVKVLEEVVAEVVEEIPGLPTLSIDYFQTAVMNITVALVQADHDKHSIYKQGLITKLLSAVGRRDKTLSKNDDKIQKADVTGILKNCIAALVNSDYIDAKVAAMFIDYMFDERETPFYFRAVDTKAWVYMYNGAWWERVKSSNTISAMLLNFIEENCPNLAIDAAGITSRVMKYLVNKLDVGIQVFEDPDGNEVIGDPFNPNFDRPHIHATRNGAVIFDLKTHGYKKIKNRPTHYQLGGGDFIMERHDDNEPPRCPMFLKLINDSFSTYTDEERQQIIDYLQEFFCYCLTYRRTDCILVLRGKGRNGKSIVMRVLEALVGETLTGSIDVNKLDNDFALMGLPNSKLAMTDEVDGNIMIDPLKRISGGAKVSVNIKYGDIENVKITAQMILATNYDLKFKQVDDALAGRLVVIDFRRRFSEAEAQDMVARLDGYSPSEYVCKNELPGVMEWALRAFPRLSEKGMKVSDWGIPPVLRRTTDEVLNRSTFLTTFLSEYIIKLPGEHWETPEQGGRPSRMNQVPYKMLAAAYPLYLQSVENINTNISVPCRRTMASVVEHFGYGWEQRLGGQKEPCLIGGVFNVGKFVEDVGVNAAFSDGEFSPANDIEDPDTLHAVYKFLGREVRGSLVEHSYNGFRHLTVEGKAVHTNAEPEFDEDEALDDSDFDFLN